MENMGSQNSQKYRHNYMIEKIPFYCFESRAQLPGTVLKIDKLNLVIENIQ